MTYRPGGVIALAIIFIILAVLSIIGGISLEVVLIATNIQQASFSSLLYLIIALHLGFPLGPTLLSTTLLYASYSSSIGYFHVGAVVAFIFGALYILTGVGLLYMKKWSYYLALIIGILMIIGGIFGLFAIVGLIPLIFGIVVVVYLSGDVKYEFE